MKIASITTKDGETIPLGKLTVLVGANNVGKSRTLRDVQDLIVNGSATPTILVKSVAFEKPPKFSDLLVGIEVVSHPTTEGFSLVRGIGANLQGAESLEMKLDGTEAQFAGSSDLSYLLGNLAKLHVSYLDAGSRLLVSRQSPSHNAYDAAPGTLLQALYMGREPKETQLRTAFKDTFGMDIRLDHAGLQSLLLRVASEFAELPADPRDQVPIMRQYQRLDEQGDGFRSFVGVALSVLLSEGRIILLDEPEAFLHPMQARVLGFWLAEQVGAGSSQVVVSTHNSNFLAGILAAQQQVDIYRLNRSENKTVYNLMSADTVNELSRSPTLSSQRVLEAIFHKGVVVCEADADRAVYESVAVQNQGNRNMLFIHAHNKQTLQPVVKLLKNASIPVCAIADIDILNSAPDLVSLVNTLAPGCDSAEILKLQATVATAINGRPEAEVLAELTADVKQFVEQLDKGEHELAGARGALSRIRSAASKWSVAKKEGISGMPAAVQADATALLTELKKLGLFVVPVGELESWIDVGTTQKNKWIVPALEEIGKGNAGDKLTAFVGEVLAFLAKQ